jgi:hypothetical protein
VCRPYLQEGDGERVDGAEATPGDHCPHDGRPPHPPPHHQDAHRRLQGQEHCAQHLPPPPRGGRQARLSSVVVAVSVVDPDPHGSALIWAVPDPDPGL